MQNKISISSGFIDTGFETKVSIETNEDDRLEAVLKGIEVLIGSIDEKELGDFEKFNDSMNRILYNVADHIGFNGWYGVSPDYNIQYNDWDEGYVTNQEKRLLLRQYIQQEEDRENR